MKKVQIYILDLCKIYSRTLPNEDVDNVKNIPLHPYTLKLQK